MKKIALIPIYNSLEQNRIFDNSNVRDNILEPMEKLKLSFENLGLSLNTNDINSIESSDAFLFYRIDLKLILKLFLSRKLKKSIYLPLEPEIVDQFHSNKNLKIISKIFGKTLTWNDEIINKERIYKCYWVMPYQRQKFAVDFNDKKLLVNISGNKTSKGSYELYSERLKTISYFENNYLDELDLYGIGWDEINHPCYKGIVENKSDVLKNYKFAVCYENMENIEGYITEKMFDCFYANTVPVYWGAKNIDKYVPTECFVNRMDFKDNETLREYLVNMSESDYNEKINAINNYLESEKYKLFLPKNYADTIFLNLKNIEEVKYSTIEALVSISKYTFLKLKLNFKEKIFSIIKR
ncbi:glycosyltransferase family 10 domain-containing protein [Flavobacterium sp.]|uniref:glycosyltransferase family 10 domain-containing protein n=1 Tax=Flavobacterium sp. TaxID=239 RepID=UPI003D152967